MNGNWDVSQVSTLEKGDWKGKAVLCRVDFNVAVGEDGIVDGYEDYRIRAALPTVKELTEKGAKVILLTHRGRPLDNPGDVSVEPIRKRVEELLQAPVEFLPELYGDGTEQKVRQMLSGRVGMLPNARTDKGEVTASEVLAKRLAVGYDAYVNEAFSVCHRVHASVAILPRFLPAFAGRRLVEELEVLGALRKQPEKPYVAIVSGNKVVTKIGLLYRLLESVDKLCIGGRLANVFLAAERKHGAENFNANDLAAARTIWDKYHDRIILPEDVVCGKETGEEAQVCSSKELGDEHAAYDIGPNTVRMFTETAAEARTVMWNGPVGKCEVPEYADGTRQLARNLAELTNYRVIGGGDTVTALEKVGVRERFNHVSVGGGAMVTFLEGKRMPGVEALKR